jgi:hypothetical protein
MRAATDVDPFLLLGISKSLQEIGEASGNVSFQDISAIATNGVANSYPNGSPEIFCFISLRNSHVRTSRAKRRPRPTTYYIVNPLSLCSFRNLAAQTLGTLMRNHERLLLR